jgi:hypothetical protein
MNPHRSMKLLLLAALSLASAYAQETTAPDWVLEGTAPWQARDSQAEWVFKDQLWIGGGWFQSFENHRAMCGLQPMAKSGTWSTKNAPWLHSDLPMSITFATTMWIMGGWYKGRLPGHSASNQVWSSGDGMKWEQVDCERRMVTTARGRPGGASRTLVDARRHGELLLWR